MFLFSIEDKIIIQNDYEVKADRLTKLEQPSIQKWDSSVKCLFKKFREIGSIIEDMDQRSLVLFLRKKTWI